MLHVVPTEIQASVRDILRQNINSTAELVSFTSVSGGCINNGGRLKTSAGDFFLKWNDSNKFPGMFEAEAKGLALLSKPAVIDIAKVVGFSISGSHQFLILNFVESSLPSPAYWIMLGQQLAALHKNKAADFGLDHSNYIGSLRQVNNHKKKWSDFFIDERLQVQLKLAVDRGRIETSQTKKFEHFFKKLPDLLPDEVPSLIHGDLWSGNLIVNANGDPCLIDPAVYYGHREAELAFTKLFGGFDSSFYESYHRQYPLQTGFERRIEIYNLYPLLVHVNLFGGGYVRQVLNILSYFA
jgi:fructosamine-3-kinase